MWLVRFSAPPCSLKAGAFIFELSRNESNVSDQKPSEYAAVVVAAALKEGYEGPVFIQGDHYQANANGLPATPRRNFRGFGTWRRNPLPQAITTSTSTPRLWWTSANPECGSSSARILKPPPSSAPTSDRLSPGGSPFPWVARLGKWASRTPRWRN